MGCTQSCMHCWRVASNRREVEQGLAQATGRGLTSARGSGTSCIDTSDPGAGTGTGTRTAMRTHGQGGREDGGG
jgi:hypothetical protein